MDILSKDPEIAKKMVYSLKNRNSQIFSQDFSNVELESESDILPWNGHDSS